MHFRGALIYCGAMAAVLAGSMVARAGSVSVTATFNSTQPNTVATNLKSNYNDNNAGLTTTTVSTVAGIYNFTATHITADPSPTPLSLSSVEAALGITVGSGGSASGVFQAICIDLTHNITYGQSATWTVQNLAAVGTAINGVGLNANQNNAIAYLWNEDFPVATVDAAAAFQMAVWDIIYNGGGTSLSSRTATGSLFANTNRPTVSYSTSGNAAADAATAQLWASGAADAVLNHGYTATNVYALIDTGQVQNFSFAIVGAGPSNTTPVPLPDSAGVGFCMLAGFGTLFAFRKRRNRRSRITD